jgi:hypothetical protein
MFVLSRAAVYVVVKIQLFRRTAGSSFLACFVDLPYHRSTLKIIRLVLYRASDLNIRIYV